MLGQSQIPIMFEINENQMQAATRLFTGTGWRVNVQCVDGEFTFTVQAGNMKYLAHGPDLLEAARKVAVDAGVIPPI